MVEDSWHSLAVPILEALAAAEGRQDLLTIGDLADRTLLDPQLIAVEVERLANERYLYR